jgi:hypothetical protein
VKQVLQAAASGFKKKKEGTFGADDISYGGRKKFISERRVLDHQRIKSGCCGDSSNLILTIFFFFILKKH